MESVAAAPQDALTLIRASLTLIGQAGAALEKLPDDVPAARNLYDALMENRVALAALEATAGLLAVAYNAGREDERAAALRRRRPLRAVKK